MLTAKSSENDKVNKLLEVMAKKIGDDHRQPRFISTIFGVGYKHAYAQGESLNINSEEDIGNYAIEKKI